MQRFAYNQINWIITNTINMKICNYEPPRVTLMTVTQTNCLMASNGENLRMSTYGNRGNSEDDTDGFWD